MARPLATDRELNRLRKEGLAVTEANLRKVKAMMQKEATARSTARNKAAGKAANGKAAASRAVADPAGRFAKGGAVRKKKACGGAVKKKSK